MLLSIARTACAPLRFCNRRQVYARALSSSKSEQCGSDASEHEQIVSVDRSALYQPPPPPSANSGQTASPEGSEPPTALTKELQALIQMRGPVTVAEFMRHALCHPVHGYYMRRDVFGRAGDFTTAPEISQMFGELIGIWCISIWDQMGRPPAVSLVELGPGRGTLMADVLRTASQFPAFRDALSVHMVDVSPALKDIQRGALESHTSAGIDVTWTEELSEVPAGTPLLLVAQEFFDALPIHQFEYSGDESGGKGWCERLVSWNDSSGDEGGMLEFVLSRGATPASWAFLNNKEDQGSGNAAALVPPTLHGDGSARADADNDPVKSALRHLRGPSAAVGQAARAATAGSGQRVDCTDAQDGDRVEVCPVAMATAEDVARRIARDGGGALFIDYGHTYASQDSLRAIADHKFVHALTKPGEADLSADVDFGALARVANAVDGVAVADAIGQGDFLINMGIQHRLAALLSNCESEEQQEVLFESYERLVEDDQMGAIYKVMGIVHESVKAASQGSLAGFTPAT